MPVVTNNFQVTTKGYSDVVDITKYVSSIVASLGVTEAQVTVFIGGSTAGITTIEYEPGLLKDLPALFERMAPSGERYFHDDTWGDGNGAAHVRAALIGCSITIPVSGGLMLLGTWQQIVLVDFDNRPRNRNVVVQVIS